MSLPPSVAEVMKKHVLFQLESIDRMYLNVYVPQLQRERGVVSFFRYHRRQPVASSTLMGRITEAFLRAIERFVRATRVPLVLFRKGQRKDDIAREHLARFRGEEGVLFVGKAQEKVPVFRTEKRRNPVTGQSYPWIVRSTAMVNQFYFYCLDRDFGPFFLKFGSYFPYTGKLCLNGHEYLKRQLAREGISFEALDNGLLSCEDVARAQRIANGLSAGKIDALLRKWLRRLPHPFAPKDRAAGYRYALSILQAEFSLTQVLDRPLAGRAFFEEVIRENLDLGRPDHVQLVFGRRVTRRTPGRFRTRVITQGVTPSLYVDYKSSRIKQYHKEGRALRTETTINNTRDFAIGKRLCNLPALRKVGFQANRRLLDVQRISHDCAIGEEAFRTLNEPVHLHGQRASALRFADPRVRALLHALVLFRLLPEGFSNRNLREHYAHLLGEDPRHVSAGQMTYHLRRLRLHGLIERIPKTHRYEVTPAGWRTALFLTRTYARLFRSGLSRLHTPDLNLEHPLRRSFDQLEAALDEYVLAARLAG